MINNSGSLSNKSHEAVHGGQIAYGLVDIKAGTSEISYLAPGVSLNSLEYSGYRANYGVTGDGDLGFGSNVPNVCGLDDINFNNVVRQGKAQNR